MKQLWKDVVCVVLAAFATSLLAAAAAGLVLMIGVMIEYSA